MWGQLWDQTDNIALHTQKGVEFLERYSSFIKERCVIEVEYAKQLRVLSKKYQPKKKEEEDYQFSYGRAFLGVLQELGDMAGQHEIVSETFREQVLRDIANTAREIKEQRKIHLSELQRLHQQLDGALDSMYKTRKEYCRAFKEAEAAQLKYQKAEGNMDLSRAELEKAKNTSFARTQQQEDAKNTYALQLQRTNELQQQHYQELLPSVFEKLRTMDETRISYMQKLIRDCVEIERAVIPIIQKCLDGMLQQAERIEPRTDSELVVERYRSGYLPPQDMLFEDLGTPLGAPPEHPSSSANFAPAAVNGLSNGAGLTPPLVTDQYLNRDQRKSLPRTKSNRGTQLKKLFGTHKPDEPKEDYSDLPPSQRCKKLERKIEHLNKEIDTRTQTRDGLIKMHQCYQENPKLGDNNQVDAQLVVVNQELDALSIEHAKFQGFLTEARSQMNFPINAALGGALVGSGSPSGLSTARSPSSRTSLHSNGAQQQNQRSSLSEESVSSESSMGQRQKSPNRTLPAPNQGCSPESGIAETSNLSFADGVDVYENYNDLESLQILGTGNALYTFDGCSDGTIPMRDGEEMLLLEKDEGDGWTRVRKQDTQAEGFVPTSYLDCRWYPNV